MTEKQKYPSAFTIDTFSSTVKLADNEVKVPIGSKETINEKDELYNPFDHRDQEYANSTYGSFIHLVKSSLGSGILAMPLAFKSGGLVVGGVGTIIVGIICTHCVHLLVKASHDICEKTKTPQMGFSETAKAAFSIGPKPLRPWALFASVFVDVALLFTYCMGNGVYVVFICESLKQVVDFNFPDMAYWNIRIYMAFVLVPLIVTCQFRELKFLVPFSFFANVFMVTSFGITLYYMFNEIPDFSDRNLFSSVEAFPAFFSTVLFAMEGIGMVLPVANSMRYPQHFLGCPGVLNGAMSVVVFLYGTMGFFGYLKYGDAIRGSITLNLPVEDVLAQVVKVCIALSVFLTFSLQFHVPMEITKRMTMHRIPENRRNISEYAMRTAVVTVIVAIAAAVPNLEPIIGLVGSICFSILGIFIPTAIDLAFRWEDDPGYLKWRLWKNGCLVLIAIFALVAGTNIAVHDIIKSGKHE